MSTDKGKDVGRRSPNEWRALSWVGLCLAVVGTVDLTMGLYPFDVGVPEWEYAAIADFLNRVPLLGLGLAFALAAALRRGFRRRALGWSTALMVLGVAVLVLGLLHATNLPLVMVTQGGGMLKMPLYKAMAKSGTQLLVYVPAFIGVGLYAGRRASRMRAA